MPNTSIQPKPEVAWKRGLRALVSKKMASAQASRKISHKCCAAALCNNRSENRPDLIYYSFPSDENLRRIWNQKMKRGDTKFASNTSLFCCSEHFRKAIDYKKSLCGRRHDLVKDAAPSIFPWSVSNEEGSERSERAKSREIRKIQFSPNRSASVETEHDLSCDLHKEVDMKRDTQGEEDLVAEINELKQKLFLSKFGLERFGSNDDDIFFYTGFPSYKVLMACLGFVIFEAITGVNSTSRLLPFLHSLGFEVQHLLSGVIFLSSDFLVMSPSFHMKAIT